MPNSCVDCGAAFARSEHLQRHRRKHLGLRPFTCEECGSTFSRKDTLSRHRLAHDPLQHARKRRKHAYVSKACMRCAKSKQRCNGELPCARCSSKQLSCSYTAPRHELRSLPSPGSPRSIHSGKHSHNGSSSQDTLSMVGSSLFENDHSRNLSLFAIAKGMEIEADTNCVFPAVSKSSDVTEPPRQPSMVTEHYIDDLSVMTEDNNLGDWGWGNFGIPWSQDKGLLFEDDYSSFPSPITTFLDASAKPCNLSTVFNPTSPAWSEPAAQLLESEAPAPSFTQTIRTCGLGASKEINTSLRSHDASTPPISGQDPELWMAEDYGHVPCLASDTYAIMTSAFTRLNCDSECCVPFTNRDFPLLNHMQIYIQVYFEEFHPVFPLLHKATFSPSSDKWVLSLAVAAVGCLFSQNLRSVENFYILHELLRRAIHIQLERTQSSPPDICIAQAAVLNQVGMMFSGEMRFAEISQTTMAMVATMCRKMAYYHFGPDMPAESDLSVGQTWSEWIKKESRLRLFYCSWLLGCQHNWFWGLPITLPIEFLQFPMPSHESAWDASSSDQWQHSLRNDPNSHPSATLRQRLLDLYRVRAPSQLGAFNTLLLIMGVYRDAPRLRRTALYMNILQQYAETLPPSNLTRVVLDHIHLASIFLHIPCRELFAFSGWRVTEAQQVRIATKLQRWMQNQSEARTVLMHAGRVWSAIRMKRTAAQHESMGFLLASITIWALIELQNRPSSNEVDTLPTVRLDGNSDDVMRWATSTEAKRLYLGGVGCLWGEAAIARLVRVTVEILDGGMAWPQAKVTAPVLRQHYYSWQQIRRRTAMLGQS